MSISRIVLHPAPGEMRAAAFDADGEPVRLFLERWGGDDPGLRLGQKVLARLREHDPRAGGAFLEASAGQAVFIRGDLPKGLSQGAEATIEICAEARRDKLARGVWSEPSEPEHEDAFSSWLASLPGKTPGAETASSPADFDLVATAFDAALSQQAGLPKGGLVRLERTTALIAADIDTAGRQQKGSAAARALSTNKEAVRTIARLLALKDWGGLAVIDCIGPLNADAKGQLRETFLRSFGEMSSRKAEALKPSSFGLLEAKLEWGATPIEDRLLDGAGSPTPDTELLDLFRAAEREAVADRTGFFRLTLSPQALKAYIGRRKACDAILQDAFSGRVSIASGTGEQSVVRRA